MEKNKVIAKIRNKFGSSESKKLRRSGKVPGIIYGSNIDPTNIEIEHNDIRLALDVESFHSSILEIELEGKIEKVLLRDFQVHPYKQQVTHIDFQRIDESKELHTNVPLHFVGEDECPAVKFGGGIVSHIMNEIELSCLPKNLPEFIEVDISGLDIGNSIHVSEIKVPSDVNLILHGQDDPVVVTAIKPKGTADDVEGSESLEAAEQETTEEESKDQSQGESQ
jgi:large subunit ribosomal protein L25